MVCLSHDGLTGCLSKAYCCLSHSVCWDSLMILLSFISLGSPLRWDLFFKRDPVKTGTIINYSKTENNIWRWTHGDHHKPSVQILRILFFCFFVFLTALCLYHLFSADVCDTHPSGEEGLFFAAAAHSVCPVCGWGEWERDRSVHEEDELPGAEAHVGRSHGGGFGRWQRVQLTPQNKWIKN